MQMGLCKDCKWWERRRSSTEWRACVLTRTHDYTEDHPDSLATALVTTDGWDATATNAALVTAPEFGCVQFEAR